MTCFWAPVSTPPQALQIHKDLRVARHESFAEGVGDLVRRSVAHRGATVSLPISLMKVDTAFVSRGIVSEKFSRSWFTNANPRVVFDR